MPRIRVLAGESPSTLKPITANSGKGYAIKTSSFEGTISVYLKDYKDEKGNVPQTEYFEGTEREGCSWSIQARGRFLKEMNADDVLFGNVFDRPLPLPHGTKVAVKFMHYTDPTLEDDLYCEKPWALSPLISTMSYMAVSEDAPDTTSPFVEDDTSSLPTPEPVSTTRKLHFKDIANRQAVTFKPSQYISCDFCHGYLSFADNGLGLTFPMVHFDLMKYWDGRPVWFVCCERDKVSGKGPGNMIWCVGFEIIEDGKEDDISADVD